MDASEFNPDQYLANAEQQQPPAAATPSEGFNPDEYLQQATQEKYDTPLEQGKTFLEGVAQGALGPIATALEVGGKGIEGPLKPLLKDTTGFTTADKVRAREEAHPIIHGAGELIGFGASALNGRGEAALMSELGEAAAKGVGLGAPTSLAAKVGSSAVKNAVEMAVMSSGDEVAKQIVQDPSASAQSAIANIGLSAALGGAGGAFLTGAASPLWKASGAGEKIEQALTSINKHLNGGSVELPEVVQKAVTDLGIEPPLQMKAALSGDPKALEMSRDLYRAQNPKFMSYLKELPEQASKSVTESLGIPLEEVTSFSNKEAGDNLRDQTVKRINEEYGPISEALNKRAEESAKIAVPDEERLNFASKLMEHAVTEVGTDSPYYKLYTDYAQRALAKDDIGGLDKLRTELFNRSSMDRNEKFAFNNIRNMIGDFQESQIAKQGASLGKEGKQLSAELLNERAEASRQYKEYAQKLDKLTDFLGIGDFRGTGALKDKLAGITSEDLVKKFGTKGDAEGAQFLKQNFPDIAEQVRQHESKQFLSKSVKDVLGEPQLDLKGLNKRIEETMKGSPEHIKAMFPQEALDKIKSAKILNDSIAQITNIKDSGTPAGMMKLFGSLGANAMGAVGWLMGHNPIGAAMIGHVGKILTVDAPQAVKLAMLKHLASDAPIKAEGFKAMVDYFQHNIKAEKYMNTAVDSIFKTGATASISIPSAADLAKLDRLVAKNDTNPQDTAQRIANGQTGHYLPDHQVALSQSTMQMMHYLQSIKPRPMPLGPLDKPIDPSAAQTARYHRALAIAENPMVVMQHIKQGTLQTTDIQDLSAMYPSLVPKLTAKLTQGMASKQASEEPIPYNTRIGMSLLMGQHMDNSMTPASIMAAQPPPQSPPPQSGGQGATKHNTSKLGKSNSQYETPIQAADKRRLTHD